MLRRLTEQKESPKCLVKKKKRYLHGGEELLGVSGLTNV
jgi:hypothetical protein